MEPHHEPDPSIPMMQTAPPIDLAEAAPVMESMIFVEHVPARKRVLVFRTSVANSRKVECLSAALDRLAGSHGRWTIDLEDRDRVLRLESSSASHAQVIGVLRSFGEQCSELD